MTAYGRYCIMRRLTTLVLIVGCLFRVTIVFKWANCPIQLALAPERRVNITLSSQLHCNRCGVELGRDRYYNVFYLFLI